MAMRLSYDSENKEVNDVQKMDVDQTVNYIYNLTGMDDGKFRRFIGQKSKQYRKYANSDLFAAALAFSWDIKLINGAGEEICVDPESLLLGVQKGKERISLVRNAKEDYILDTEIEVENLRKKLKAAEALLNNLKRE